MGSATPSAWSSLCRLLSPVFQRANRTGLPILDSAIHPVSQQAAPSPAWLHGCRILPEPSGDQAPDFCFNQKSGIEAVVFLYDSVLFKPLGASASWLEVDALMNFLEVRFGQGTAGPG